MSNVNAQEKLASAAVRLARELDADLILTLTEEESDYKLVLDRVEGRRIVAATSSEEIYKKLRSEEAECIKLSYREPSRMGQIRHAVLKGLQGEIFSPGELLVALIGGGWSREDIGTLSVHRISGDERALGELVESDPVMNAVVGVAAELGWEARRGEPIGAAFMIGDHEKVLNLSRQLGVNPYKGYDSIKITDKDNWEMVKEHAFLDGAFVLDWGGNLVAAGRFLDADVPVDIPSGLGTRHRAVASMTAATHARGVTVSATDSVIRIFDDGEIVLKIDSKSRLMKGFE